jgi:hypothetical protein
MSPQITVELIDGPFDGSTVQVAKGSALLCEGPPLPDGTVARYRPTREPGKYRFRGLDQVAVRIPIPGGAL